MKPIEPNKSCKNSLAILRTFPRVPRWMIGDELMIFMEHQNYEQAYETL